MPDMTFMRCLPSISLCLAPFVQPGGVMKALVPETAHYHTFSCMATPTAELLNKCFT